MLSWWYGAGWKARALMIRERLEQTLDYFSIDILLRTLFSPYRQISAGQVSGPLAVKWRAFVDRTISRIIGAIVRTMIILIGSFTIVFYALLGVFVLLLWACLPLLPVVGFVLFISGWVPPLWK